MKEKLKLAIKNPYRILSRLMYSHSAVLSDKALTKIKYRAAMGKKLNLENPQTFNEKLQWLKLYNRKPEYTRMVDKYGVREYIKEKIGEEYLIPLLGVWDKFSDIDFDKLPDKFVLKATHDSGNIVICKKKADFNIKAAEKKLNKALKTKFFYRSREWPYKNVKPRIIAEEFMIDERDGELRDYKFFCTNGRVDNVMVCAERESGDTKYYFFDKDWNLLKYNKRALSRPNHGLEAPKKLAEMFEIASKLSEGLPFLRVDLYHCNGKIYFGELTFYPASGFDSNLQPETDKYFGSLIDLEMQR